MIKKTAPFWIATLCFACVTGWTQYHTVEEHTFAAIDYDNKKLMEIGLDGQIKRSVPVGDQPHEVQIDAKNGRLFVTNTMEPTVSIIESASFRHLDHLRSEYFGQPDKTGLPHGMAQSPDGDTLYITTERYDRPGVVAYDWKNRKVRKYIEIGQQGGHLIRLHPSRQKAYVMNRRSNSISVIDTTQDIWTKNISLPDSPVGIDFSPSGDLWVAANNGTVHIIDMNSEMVRKQITGKGTGNGRMYVSSNGRWGIATHADGADVFDAVKEQWTTYFPLENDQSATGIKHAIYVCFSPNNDRMYISLINASAIAIYDTTTFKEIGRWKLPARAYSLDLLRKGR